MFTESEIILQACKMKLGDLKGALLDADFALRETDGNAKAFFRQGQVGIDRSIAVISSSLCLSPNNRLSATACICFSFCHSLKPLEISYCHSLPTQNGFLG
jgi:hypothetical protein